MKSTVIGEKVVWARAETWQSHGTAGPTLWVGSGLCGWSYHGRKWTRSETSARSLSQNAERLKKVHWAPCTESVACRLFCGSFQWKENNGDICIVTRNGRAMAHRTWRASSDGRTPSPSGRQPQAPASWRCWVIAGSPSISHEPPFCTHTHKRKQFPL